MIRRIIVLVALLLSASAEAERIKDLAHVLGVRNNQLVGYGLVVGLAQTGDDLNVPFTQQSILAMLRRLGTLSVDSQQLRTRDVAAVIVTALVPPFAKNGAQVDVTVAALGNARSLQGGVLIQTPLRSNDGRTYAVAQGSVLLGGLLASGATGSSVQRNHVTTGRIPEGAILERDMPGTLKKDVITLILKQPDFTTASRVTTAIGKVLGSRLGKDDPDKEKQEKEKQAQEKPQDGKQGERFVRALSPGTIEITIPEKLRDQTVELTAQLEELEVEPDVPARVVVNERTGVVVVGANVRLGRAAVSYGRLTVRIDEGLVSSQPNPLGGGDTRVVPQTRLEQSETQGPMRLVGPSAKVEDIVQSLNQLGVSTRDLVAIMHALKLAGALRAELIIE